MGSGMNLEKAKEYAKTMTYRQAVANVRTGRNVLYKKATMIKLRELAEIADALDRNEVSRGCETCIHIPHDDYIETENDHLEARCLNCHNAKVCKEKHWEGCVFEPQNGYQTFNGTSVYVSRLEDEPQTEIYCKDEIWTEAREMLKKWAEKDEPQTERSK